MNLTFFCSFSPYLIIVFVLNPNYPFNLWSLNFHLSINNNLYTTNFITDYRSACPLA